MCSPSRPFPRVTTLLVLCRLLALGTKSFGSRPRLAAIYFKRSPDQVSACEYNEVGRIMITYHLSLNPSMGQCTLALTPLSTTPRCLAIDLSPRTNPPPIDPIPFLLVI